jgi:hypothetical protein
MSRRDSLENHVAMAQALHLVRGTLCHTIPLKKRGPRKKRRPKTVLITLAVQAKIEDNR